MIRFSDGWTASERVRDAGTMSLIAESVMGIGWSDVLVVQVQWLIVAPAVCGCGVVDPLNVSHWHRPLAASPVANIKFINHSITRTEHWTKYLYH